MHPVDKAASRVPLLLNDFFRHQHNLHFLRTFLCGQQPLDKRFDLRIAVKRLLESRMGCKAFLGEDIADLTSPPKADRDHLSIEVKEASRSDLIIMFLGSPGTMSELTAFAMNKEINPKLVVFNDIKHKDAKSFINLGPLRLLTTDRVIYYDPTNDAPSVALVSDLDMTVSAGWYRKTKMASTFNPPIEFESFAALLIIHAAAPVRHKELTELFPWDDKKLNAALKDLFDRTLVWKQEEKFLCRRTIKQLPTGGLVADAARVRAGLMGLRLKRTETVTDYRLII